jgi:hypothetical protein
MKHLELIVNVIGQYRQTVYVADDVSIEDFTRGKVLATLDSKGTIYKPDLQIVGTVVYQQALSASIVVGPFEEDSE